MDQEFKNLDPEMHPNAKPQSGSLHDDLRSSSNGILSLSIGNTSKADVLASAAAEKPLLKPPNLPQPASFGGANSLGRDASVALIQPENIHWIYLDASGNEQGPFAGDVMQEWLGDGYLSLELQIRRQEQSVFQSLRLFCESINNYILPFKTPLPPVGSENQNSVTTPMQHADLLYDLRSVLQIALHSAAPLISRNASAFGSQMSSVVPDSVSAQATGVTMASNNLFGANQQPSLGTPGVQPTQSSFNSKLYPQMMPNNGFGGSGLRALSLNLMFDYNGSNDYSLMNPLFSPNSQFGLDSLNQNIGGAFGQLHMPSLLHQQIHGQQPVLSRANSGWAVDTSLPNHVQTPVQGGPAPLSISQAGLSSLSQPSPMSPWINRVSSTSRAPSPFIPNASLSNEDTVLNDLHSSMVTGILNEEEPSINYFQQRSSLSSESETKGADPSNQISIQQPILSTISVPATRKPVEEAASAKTVPAAAKTEQKVSKTNENNTSSNAKKAQNPNVSAPAPVAVPVAAAPASVPAPVQVEAPVEAVAEKAKAPVKLETSVAVPAVTSASAPWAKKAPESEVPIVTLKEVQRMEAEWLEKEKQTKAEIQRELALASAIAASKAEERNNAGDKVPSFNWAVSSQEAVAKKTLAEIQQEEEEAARSKAMKKTASGSTAFKSSLASTLASSVPRDDAGGAWTAVTKKSVTKKPVLQTVTPVVSYSQMSGAINPQALRSASSADVPTSTVNSNALKEDFLIWARSAMTNLYPSVSKDDLLEVFTTLPAHGDLQQLISETIYSSSATMDGRRFAQEFMKKRQQVERQIGSNAVGSWSLAISSSADKTPVVDDEGWSTSKSKKKGKKY